MGDGGGAGWRPGQSWVLGGQTRRNVIANNAARLAHLLILPPWEPAQVHASGFIHRDVKPANFVMSPPNAPDPTRGAAVSAGCFQCV